MIQLWGTKVRTESTGLASIVCAYHVDTLSEALVAGAFQPPVDAPASLKEHFGERIGEKWIGGGYIFNVTFEGIVNAELHQWGLYPSFKEAKLVTHPNFLALIKKYGGIHDQTTGNIMWSADYGGTSTGGLSGPGAGAGQGRTQNPMFGQDSYVEVGMVYRSNRVVTKPPGSILARLGRIVDKLPDDVEVETPEGRNWLIMPSPFVKRGEVYEDDIEMLLSPPGRKWNEDVYDFILGLGGGLSASSEGVEEDKVFAFFA